MAAEIMVLISAIIILLFTSLLLYMLVRSRGEWRLLRREKRLPLPRLIAAGIILAIANAFLTSFWILIPLLLVTIVAGFLFSRQGIDERPEEKSSSEENVIDLPASHTNGRPGKILAKPQPMIDPSHYSLQVNRAVLSKGVEIAYTDTGTGPSTLVFVHGLGSNRKCWRKNILALRQHHRCIAVDLPGYGQSSKNRADYTMSFFAQKLIEFIQVMRLRNPVLVGHSMGGQICMTAALRAPGLARKLVLLAPAGFETFSATEKTLVRSFYQPALIRATPAEQIRQNFASNFYQFPADAEFMVEDRLRLRDSKDHLHYSRMIPKCMMGMMEEPVLHRLSEIRQPTLIIFGADDQLIPNKMLHPGLSTVAVAENGAAGIPVSRLEIMRPGGHFVQWECAAAVNRSIHSFLS